MFYFVGTVPTWSKTFFKCGLSGIYPEIGDFNHFFFFFFSILMLLGEEVLNNPIYNRIHLFSTYQENLYFLNKWNSNMK